MECYDVPMFVNLPTKRVKLGDVLEFILLTTTALFLHVYCRSSNASHD